MYNMCTMLDQRRRRWADVVQMLYKWSVFAEKAYARGCECGRSATSEECCSNAAPPLSMVSYISPYISFDVISRPTSCGG